MSRGPEHTFYNLEETEMEVLVLFFVGAVAFIYVHEFGHVDRTLQETFVDDHENLLFDDLAPLMGNLLAGCWITIPCCLTIASVANLRYNS